jgi:hypothetical protein
MESLARIGVSRKTGAEPFTAAGRPVGPTVADFWGWSRSDLLDNTERGVLAEFIVATAQEIPADGVREGWATWDLTTPGGVRVEVKSAAYLQSWAQKELSRISFNTPKTLAWDADGGGKTYAAGSLVAVVSTEQRDDPAPARRTLRARSAATSASLWWWGRLSPRAMPPPLTITSRWPRFPAA